MKKITLIKNARLLDKENGYNLVESSILIEDGIIVDIGSEITEPCDGQVIDLKGKILSPGFIDMHVHCYKGDVAISAPIDEIGVNRGATTIVDAGTSGANTVDDFYNNFAKKAKTRVFACLNISSDGLNTLHELDDLNKIDENKVLRKVKEREDFIVALKARASSSVVKENGITPIQMGKDIATKSDLPLVVHIGNAPPKTEDVLDILGRGDIVAHCYNNKVNNLVRDGKLIKEGIEARERGVIFDMAHGTASFSFDTAKEAMEDGFYADIISTDIYDLNMNRIVFSLEHTINKMIYLGLPLEEAISKVTTAPARVLKLKKLGQLRKGFHADFTIFNYYEDAKESISLRDSVKKIIDSTNYISTEYVFINNELIKTWR